MVANVYHIRNRITKEAMYDWAERENSVLDYMRKVMANEMAHGLLEHIPIDRVPEPYYGSWDEKYYVEYEINCVVLDEREYKELMIAKRDLQTLRGIMHGG